MSATPHIELARRGKFWLFQHGRSSGSGLGTMFRRVVFRESFTGDGIQTVFSLTGAVGNATFASGTTWKPSQILVSLPAHITKSNKKPAYDGINPFTKHRISVQSIDSSGNVTLDYVPRSDEDIYIWYWYELAVSDVIEDYYREDFVSSVESDALIGGIVTAADVVTNTSTFGGFLGAGDSNVQIALENYDQHTHNNDFFAEANCQSTDAVGDVMYISGDRSGGRWTVTKADPSDTSKMPGVGILIHKYTSTHCVVQFFGEVTSVFSGMTPNSRYFIDDTGAISTTPPTPITGYRMVQTIGLAVASDILFLPGDLNMIKRK